MKWISRAILLLMIGTGVVLMAFGPRPHAEIPPDRVIVTYWEKWTAEEAAAMKLIVDEFNNTVGAEKGIYVVYLSMAQVDRKTLTATAAGVPPDIAGLWQTNIASYAARNALTPLDDLAAEYGISSSDYKPVYWKLGTYDGRLYGLPTTPSAVALHYNKRMFYENADALRAAGLDPTRPPRTIDEFNKYAQIIDRRDRDGRLQRAGYFTMEPGWYVVYTPFWFGGKIFDEHTGEFTFDTPENRRAMQWIAGHSKRLGRDAMVDFRAGLGAFTSPQNAFFSGRVAMV